MRSDTPYALDRHVFASNASAYNSAWETVGRSPALRGDRSGRLEERVPWATELAEAEKPPVLIGDPAELSPTGELPLAFLPLDGRLGFSVSGVVQGSTDSARGGFPVRPRIATHSVLFDESLFRHIGGFPLGLLSSGAVGVLPPGWFHAFRQRPLEPGQELPPVSVSGEPEVRTTFARARSAAVEELARRVTAALSLEVACATLVGIYSAVAEARTGGPPIVVVGELWEGPRASFGRDLVLLAWLSLPLTDRSSVYCSTTWLGSPVWPCITTTPGTEVLARAVAAGRVAVVDPDEVDITQDLPLQGWARLVLGGTLEFSRASLRVDVRNASLFDPAFQGLLPGPCGLPADLVELKERVRREFRGHRRLRGLGRLTAEVLSRSSDDERASVARWLLEGEAPCQSPHFNDGMVKGLLGGLSDVVEESGAVACMAVRAGFAAGRRGPGLELAVEGLRMLIRQGQGLQELAESVGWLTRSEGVASGAEMLRIGLSLLRAAGRWHEIPEYLLTVDEAGFSGGAVAADVADALAEDVLADDRWFLPLLRLWGQVVANEAADREEFHRLAWVEHERLGASVLGRLAGQGDANARRFTRAFMTHDPPLPVFLQLRSVVGWGGSPVTAERGT